MKALRRVGIVALAVAGVLGLALGCGNPLTNAPPVNPRAAATVRGQEAPDSAYEPQVIGGPGSPLSVALLAGRTHEVGTVEAWLEEGALYVRYTTAWSLAETHLEVVADPVEFPQTRGGNPIPGRFAYKMSHDRGTDTYTYCVDMAALEAAETLYFAAHAEVEKWVGGVCVEQESAWAEGLDFPGANWATYFAGVIPAPIDLTGYWDLTVFPDEAPAMGPFQFCISQTDSTIYASPGEPEYAFSGTIVGSTVTLVGTVGTLVGTVSGEEITGRFDDGFLGTGTFRFVRSTYPFGHIKMIGMCEGVTVDLDTSYGGGYTGSETSHWAEFDVMIGSTPVQAGLSFSAGELSVGEFAVVPNPEFGSGELVATLWMPDDAYTASGGAVHLTEYDPPYMAGTFVLTFPDGSYLSGTFGVSAGGFGQSSVQGVWQEDPFSADTPNAYAEMGVRTTSYVVAHFWDNELSAWIWFNIGGPVSSGHYTVPDQTWGSLLWTPTAGPGVDAEMAAPGFLNLSYYGVDGMVGTFQTSFEGGGTVSGSFDVRFVEGENW